MTHDTTQKPFVQVPAQRGRVLERLQRTMPGCRKPAATGTLQLYDRYAAGELSWADVTQTRDAARPNGPVL